MGEKKPVIGITPDHEESGEYSPFPYYVLRENYCDVVSKNGGIPLLLPYGKDIDQLAGMIDGLVVTGGAFDIDPSSYGDTETHETVTIKKHRTEFETAITKKILEQNKPFLGICGGEQLLAVILGGTLIQHIPDEIKDALEHENKDRKNPAHDVEVVEGTLLHKIIGETKIGTNTSHHQAVKEVGKGGVVNARSSDGVIEGIEYPKYKFCLGVQWHPEYEVTSADTKIIKSFIEAA